MACARCDFYTPKDSSKGQLLEAKDNLQRMLASVPLSDEERAAVDDGQAALDQLLERLVDIRTPTGATPRVGLCALVAAAPATPALATPAGGAPPPAPHTADRVLHVQSLADLTTTMKGEAYAYAAYSLSPPRPTGKA
jgi:hypothetical protein